MATPSPNMQHGVTDRDTKQQESLLIWGPCVEGVGAPLFPNPSMYWWHAQRRFFDGLSAHYIYMLHACLFPPWLGVLKLQRPVSHPAFAHPDGAFSPFSPTCAASLGSETPRQLVLHDTHSTRQPSLHPTGRGWANKKYCINVQKFEFSLFCWRDLSF